MPLEKNVEYTINLTASNECTQVPNVLLTKGSREAVISYNSEKVLQDQIAIKYGYLKEPNIADKIVCVSLWILAIILSILFLIKYEKIKQCIQILGDQIDLIVTKKTFYIIGELALCSIILNSSGIDFQESTKIVLYIVSLFSIFGYIDRRNAVNRLIDRVWKRYLLRLLYLYAAFSLIGQRIFIYPFTLKVTIVGIFVFCITVVWFIPIVNFMIYFLKYKCLYLISETEDKKADTKLICVMISFLLLPAAYNLFANNPGITSPDTYNSIIVNARHLHGMRDWHPAFYCIMLRLILTVWDSTYAIIIVQYFFWIYVMLELLLYLKKKGMKRYALLNISFFSGINAGNFIHLNTIWKDIPYTFSVLWTMVLTAKLSLDFDEYKRKWYIYLELIIALIGTYFYRKNGIITFIIVTSTMIVILKKNIKALCTIGITFALIFIINYPIYSYLEVEKTGKYGMYIGLSQDILGVYYAQGNVSEETLKMINVMTGGKNAEYEYKSTWSNQEYDLAVEPTEFIYNYLNTFIHNPILMSRAVINRMDAVWDIFKGQDAVLKCVNNSETLDGFKDWNDYYPERVFRSIYPQMAAATAYAASNQWISAIEWRAGFFTLMGVICCVAVTIICGVKGKKYILIVAPIVGHVLSLLLTTGWSDFRYFWPLNLMNMCVILFSIVIIGKKE